MTNQKKIGLLPFMILSGLLISLVCAGCVYLEYSNYQDKLGIVVTLSGLQDFSGEPASDILKGKKQISNKEKQQFLEAYGFDTIRSSQYGRHFLSQVKIIVAGAVALYVCMVLSYVMVLRKIQANHQTQLEEISKILQKFREGIYQMEYLGEDLVCENAQMTQIYASLESLSGYFTILTRQAKTDHENTKSFVTDISHQLKTPIAALSACLEILTKKDLTDAEREEFLERCSEQMQGLIRLTDALIQISRMETGMISMNLKKAKIFDTLVEAVNRVYMKAAKKNISIELNAEENLQELYICHDTKWMCEALINVLENAVKYSPQESEIVICMARRVNFLRIEIRDCGIGIPKEEQHKIFQRFYRGASGCVISKEGSGVGLYLARKIIESHHGTIHVISDTKKQPVGSTFVLQIPCEISG